MSAKPVAAGPVPLATYFRPGSHTMETGGVGWLDPHSLGNTGLVFSTQTVEVCEGGRAHVNGCIHRPPLQYTTWDWICPHPSSWPALVVPSSWKALSSDNCPLTAGCRDQWPLDHFPQATFKGWSVAGQLGSFLTGAGILVQC